MNWNRSYGKRLERFFRRKLLEALPILLLNLSILSCGIFDNDLIRLEEDIISPNLLITGKDSIEFEGLGRKQSMVFYENIALFLYETSCDIFDLSSSKRICVFSLPCDGYLAPHANSLSLGVNRYSQFSVLPLLYVSAWDNGRQAFTVCIYYPIKISITNDVRTNITRIYNLNQTPLVSPIYEFNIINKCLTSIVPCGDI